MPGRIAPARTIKKWRAWRKWEAIWQSIFLLVGVVQAALAVLVAANVKEKTFLRPPWDLGIAITAAVLAFLIAALGAQAKAAGFEIASRELEKSITAFETDDSVTEAELGKAEQRGIDLLNKLKPN